MDRSFLSDAAVIASSRKFVCIRLATYESESEAKILKSIFLGRSGDLENTVFTILSPDGERMLIRSGRSPKQEFGGASAEAVARMARRMEQIAERYSASATATAKSASLPYLADPRLAVNVAACDSLPLVVTLARGDAERREIEKRLLPIAWSEAFAGHFLYATARDKGDLKNIEGLTIDSGFIVIGPDAFGHGGKPLAQIPAKVSEDELITRLAKAGRLHVPGRKDSRDHVRDGRRLGVEWSTRLPITDPGRRPRGGSRASGSDGRDGRSGRGRRSGRGGSDRRSGSDRRGGSDRRSGRDRQDEPPAKHPLLDALDTDGDGELSVEELSHATEALKKLDRDGDGKLSPEELRPSVTPSRQDR